MEHEFVTSVGLNVEWGASGTQDVGADRFTITTPTFYFGKGFGDIPVPWARPFALTGEIGYAIPGSSSTVTVDPDTGDVDTEFNPRVLVWGASLQYSLPYLKSAVVDLGLPDFVNHLIPLVETSLQTPVTNTLSSGTVTTGTINPGVIWVGDTFQVGVEAMIPVNRQSGSDVGAIAQIHFFLDDIFPTTPSAGRFSATASHREVAMRISRYRPHRHSAARSRARARHARPRQPARRQHRCYRAEGTAAVVHRETGAGLFHRGGARCKGCHNAKRQGACRRQRPHRTARAAEDAAARDLSGDVACSIGGHPPYARQLYIQSWTFEISIR